MVQYWLDVQAKEWLHEIPRSGEDEGLPGLIVAMKVGMVQVFCGDLSWF